VTNSFIGSLQSGISILESGGSGSESSISSSNSGLGVFEFGLLELLLRGVSLLLKTRKFRNQWPVEQ
jgi:hypothetical protein